MTANNNQSVARLFDLQSFACKGCNTSSSIWTSNSASSLFSSTDACKMRVALGNPSSGLPGIGVIALWLQQTCILIADASIPILLNPKS